MEKYAASYLSDTPSPIAVIKAQLQIWVLTAMTVEKLGAMEYTEHPADILPIQHYFYIDPRGRTLAE